MPYIQPRPKAERWKRLVRWPSYEVSTYGQVRNYRTKHILKMLSRKPLDPDYLRIRFHNGELRNVAVKNLVAEAYFPEWSPAVAVDTISGNRKDVSVYNLKVVVKNFQGRKRTKVRIVEFDKEFESIYAAAQYIHGSSAVINKILHGMGQTHKGYHFEKI